MKIYSVHYRQESGASLTGLANDAVLVKEGFSWPAFFVPFLWLIYKQMWIVFAIYMALELALAGIAELAGLPEALPMIGSLTLQAIMGFEGNNFYRWSLERRRYKQRAVVAGGNITQAEHRFFTGAERDLYAPSGAGASA